MTTSNVKSVLSPGIDTEEVESRAQSSSASETLLNYIKHEQKIEDLLKLSQSEAHEKRMQSLRKEIDYLNNTAWQFESPDKNTDF